LIVATSLVLAVAAGAAATDAVSSGESPVSVDSEGLLPWFDFGFSPKGLSRTEPIPVRLDLGFDFERGGFLPPALSPVSVELDRHFVLDGNGIPACRGLGVQGGVEPATDCRESIIGHGRETFAIGLPESRPQYRSGPVVVYYGGRRNDTTTLYALGCLEIPTPSSLDIEVDLKGAGGGRSETEASFRVPKIAAGYGSMTAFEISLYKRFAYRGRRHSFVSATCRDGKLEAVASAFRSPPPGAEAPLEESDGRTCTPER
jgi:hypothetical protein